MMVCEDKVILGLVTSTRVRRYPVYDDLAFVAYSNITHIEVLPAPPISTPPGNAH
jgi:hypothetical protein